MATTVNDIHLIGTHSGRPAAATGNKGYYYTETDTNGGTTFRSNGSSWVQVAGPVTSSGIGGSSGSTDNAVIRADGTGGATVQNSLMTIDDSGTPNIPTGQTYNINGSPHSHSGASGATVLLDSVVGVGTAASFSVSGIAAGYKYIEIFLTGKTVAAATSDNVYISFNSDTTDANYRRAHSYGGSSNGNSAADDRYVGSIGAANDAESYGTIRISIHDYDNTNFRKALLSYNMNRQTATAINIQMDALTWESNSAITAISLAATGGNFAQYTHCTILGWN